jgi:hypothetical protein
VPTDTREPRIRAAVACPLCDAGINQPCRSGLHLHDLRRGPEDLRPVLHRSHSERRLAWQEYKRAREVA